MKTCAKVFLILNIIGWALLFWTIVGILPLVFNIIGLVKLNKLDTQNKRILWGILTILLGCNPVSGILMFFLKDEDAAPAVEA
ncbi:MAG: hypothetical protein E7540_03220 [Ruminococcaceae bacterium]|nr:hypothetical protein [Oscillospiraceae bacterium]